MPRPSEEAIDRAQPVLPSASSTIKVADPAVLEQPVLEIRPFRRL
jgi:hypothetical protein